MVIVVVLWYGIEEAMLRGDKPAGAENSSGA